MSDLERSERRYSQINALFKFVTGIAIAYVIVILSVLAVQTYALQSTVVKNQVANREAADNRLTKAFSQLQSQEDQTRQHIDMQHAETQSVLTARFNCLGNVLIKPIEQRTQADVTACEVVRE